MLFLGAGASASFGIPTMSKFTEDFIAELSKTNKVWGDKVEAIRNKLVQKGVRSDIEVIMTTASRSGPRWEQAQYKHSKQLPNKRRPRNRNC